MKQLFEYVKYEILKGMPSGCLVTKNPVDYYIGNWQHKTYDDCNLIYDHLRGKWCPSTINLLLLHEDSTIENYIKYLEDNSFEKGGRHTYLTYCIAFKKSILTYDAIEISRHNKFVFSNYTNKIIYNDHVIFINDLIKNILLY
jgi:hypothetical protein